MPAGLIVVYGLGTELAGTYWLPLLAVSLVMSRFWAELFSRWRDRPLDRGWVLAAWLYALLLPAQTPLGFAALALSFGLVFGCHVFGGSGRYLVNPALLAIVFLSVSYPNPLVAAAEVHLEQAIASLLGALYLITRGAASARIIGAALGAIIVGSLAVGLSWHWHFTLGNFALLLAFVATDPTTRPATAGGCWAFGALFGALTIVLRTAIPESPEGTWSALLLASLCVPLLDHIAGWRPKPAPEDQGA